MDLTRPSALDVINPDGVVDLREGKRTPMAGESTLPFSDLDGPIDLRERLFSDDGTRRLAPAEPGRRPQRRRSLRQRMIARVRSVI